MRLSSAGADEVIDYSSIAALHELFMARSGSRQDEDLVASASGFECKN
jgi:hypothetical protein